MSDQSVPEETPGWMRDIEEFANEQLDDGSACEQVHPIVADWFERLMAGEPPGGRESVLQALSCLATEVYTSMPDEVAAHFPAEGEEDELILWLEQVLMVGRAFESALRDGGLDDL